MHLILVAVGDPVIPGVAHGVVVHWRQHVKAQPGCVLVAPSLSNEVALAGLDVEAGAIITEAGSFATHGANLLRVAAANGRQVPCWITDVRDALTVLSNNAEADVRASGAIYSTVSVGSGIRRGANRVRPTEFTKPREMVRWATGHGVLARCFWPHRRYDVFTADLMRAGLTESARSLGYACRVERTQTGHLWFVGESPSMADLCQLAVTPSRAAGLLSNQIGTYERLLDQIRHGDEMNDVAYVEQLKAIVRLIKRYFAVFLLYHNTYEDVIGRGTALLPPSGAERLAQTLSASLITAWQYRTMTVLPNEKDLFQDIPVVALPGFDLGDDLSEMTSSIREFAQTLRGTATKCQRNRCLLEYVGRVYVVKEWKFFLNKVLFSRFNDVARHLMAMTSDPELRDADGWRSLKFREVLTKLQADGGMRA